MTALAAVAALGGLGAWIPSPDLQRRVDSGVAAVCLAQGVPSEGVAVVLGRVDRASGQIQYGGIRAETTYYPASVVKLVYLAYAGKLLTEGRILMTDEFRRACQDMIVTSNNDATGLVLDAVTGTTSGPELPGPAMDAWSKKRTAVNRWLQKLGFVGQNACQKTYNEGPYGREAVFRGKDGSNANRLSPMCCARLLGAIALRSKALGIDQARFDWMDSLLGRPIPIPEGDQYYQARAFTGSILPLGSKLFSKAGYTSSVRHDVAWVVLPDATEYVLAVFTKGLSANERLIPALAKSLIEP